VRRIAQYLPFCFLALGSVQFAAAQTSFDVNLGFGSFHDKAAAPTGIDSRRVIHGLRRIVVQNAQAAFAGHHLVAFSELLEKLQAHGHIARAATALHGLRDADSAAHLADSRV
jgi:hypothetical protein